MYEMAEAGRTLMPLLPIIIRADGKAFHTFTKHMERPFDKNLSELMIATTKDAVEFTNARVGYTQSDEISLLLYQDTTDSETIFGGRLQKLTSLVAARISTFFNKSMKVFNVTGDGAYPLFDCRAWNVPTKMEAVNAFLWREQDASKNSVQMAARAKFSHSKLQNKNTKELQEMLFSEAGINWNDYPPMFKRGTFIRKKTVTRKFTASEIEKLPEKHEARSNPDLLVERKELQTEWLPRLATISNRIEVLFDGADPIPNADAKT